MQSKFPRRAIPFIVVTAFLNMVGIGIIIPVLPFLVQQYIGASNTNAIAFNVGLLTSTYAICQFLASPGLGLLSDRFGRRPILLVSLFGSMIGYIMLGIGGSLWVLYLGRVVDGLTGGNISTIFAYIADVTEPKDRGKYYGMIGAAMGFGFVVGPATGGFLANISLSAPLFAAAAITGITMLWGYFGLPESLHEHHRLSDFSIRQLNPINRLLNVMSRPALRLVLFTSFLYALPFAELQGNSSVLLKDALHWGASNIGILFFMIGIIDIIFQGFLIRKLLPKFGENRLIRYGLLLVMMGYGVSASLPFFRHNYLPFIGSTLFAIGSGLVEPSLNGLISHSAEPREQGLIQGANQSIQSIARIFGPIIAATLYQFAWSSPYILCVLLTVGAIYVVTLLPQKQFGN